MSFLQIKKDTIYLTVTNNPKLIRPLFPEAEGRWVHNIPSCSRVTPQGKKENIRFYRQVDASFSTWMKDNQDPLWDILDQQDKFDRDGNRQDFSVRPVHLLPVWDYEAQDVKIAKFGNQFFEEMTKWYDQGGKVTDCDWMCWTEGNGRRVQYKTSRQDTAPFNFQGDMNALQVKCQEMMKKAIGDMTPFKTEDDLIKFVSGATQQEATSFNFGANQQGPQQQMPGYTPGGQPATTHGAMPASLPPANPMPQATMPQTAAPAAPAPAPAMAPAPTPTPGPVAVPPAGGMPGYNPQAPVGGYVPSAPAGQGFVPQAPQQGTPGAPVPGVVQTQPEVPNAPVGGQPVFAPPVQTQAMPQQAAPAQVPTSAPVAAPTPTPTPAPAQAAPQPAPAATATAGGPADVVVDFGKYSGKTLGWVLENDRGYLTFLKGNKKEQYALHIEALLGGAGPAPAQAPAQAAPAPAPAQAAPAAVGGDEAQRQQILEQLNAKFLNIPDFQGPGIAQNMMPFLTETIGTTDFSTAPLPDLLKLNAAVDQRIAQG